MANIQERVYKNGSVKYQALIRLRGHPPQTATFERKSDAKKWVSDTESAIRNGRHFKSSESRKHTLADAVDRYIKEILPTKSPSTIRDQTHQLNWWKQQLGAYTLADISTPVVTELKQKLASERISVSRSPVATKMSADETEKSKLRSNSTVTAYLMAISHLFSVAVKEWGWAEKNPLKDVRKPVAAKGRTRFLSDGERIRLMAECKKYPDLNLAVMLSLSTGARKEEIWSLKWSRVDLTNAMIILDDTKNDETRGIALVGEALSLLKAHELTRQPDCDFVFVGKKGKNRLDLRKQWEAAKAGCDIKDFRYHDLRHTTASYLAMSGATLGEISEILGHKSLQMVKRYSHFTAGHNAKVLERMTTKMMGPAPGDDVAS
jgi:integrase